MGWRARADRARWRTRTEAAERRRGPTALRRLRSADSGGAEARAGAESIPDTGIPESRNPISGPAVALHTVHSATLQLYCNCTAVLQHPISVLDSESRTMSRQSRDVIVIVPRGGRGSARASSASARNRRTGLAGPWPLFPGLRRLYGSGIPDGVSACAACAQDPTAA